MSIFQEDQPPSAGALGARLAGYRFERDALGRSAASVFRLEALGLPTLYLKVEQAGPFGELADEAARLRWLKTSGLPCPDVIAEDSDGVHNRLLISALPGSDLTSASALTPPARVELLAIALLDLHRLPIASCPFDHRLERRVAAAKSRMQAGIVDETDFDETRVGKSAEALFAELESGRPGREDLVVTHGDACLPNFIALEDGNSGYIDCSRLGVADRYQDIALACRSIDYNFGEALVQPFLDRYGMPATDPARLNYYQLLDEFF
ncbi:APH(3') family aminoglycoside O-phosphotransferase [Rhizobium leguminosarum]|uniref:APH(3') family aminoglycoside O-phosphotransferase n=1 Tax=Rhizobium leguminosarum TaxID=384 RepID=UPI001C9293A2|nr:APH(3') family aminoglycoside O-phosphotransferase [Rhizobium leguminosarum]MBY2913052.1 aminoglycoside 3'-phosphotransferase [Rhizobium leguminosarum]MBY2921606.1 aminoglycoside 3'-phosphotransferase [Rhizobium leguminosarum]MBY2968709.1 aminoglycoside 3'-phosphotransferase [Rhizobium leguminosarum]MBY2976083.1 aminoglycoside 3'-phosphotransferase [Rhizobium leguminosarum]MBY2997573.1 aminoglycoside 3'-phosphotransferase [Rhizobium leguminosarum]